MAAEPRLSAEAVAQIASISDYIAEDSPQNAASWRAGIFQRISSLRDFPSRHEVVYTKEQAGRVVHQTFYGAYRILYTLDQSYVYVLTIRHGARVPQGPTEVGGIE
ncbi:MAG: type II toxin-antitoxin system RelE/ParE family toxin [Planctomycetota bacterium]